LWLGVNAFAAYDFDRLNSQPASRVQILSGYHDTAVRVTLQLQLRDLGSVPLLISKRYYMEEVIMSARETAELRLQVGRLVQAEGYDGELSPAQWMALRFFARANPFSRTPSAFANFKRQPAAPQHKPSRRLKRMGTWSDSHARRAGAA
jgi:hypothetical protein